MDQKGYSGFFQIQIPRRPRSSTGMSTIMDYLKLKSESSQVQMPAEGFDYGTVAKEIIDAILCLESRKRKLSGKSGSSLVQIPAVTPSQTRKSARLSTTMDEKGKSRSSQVQMLDQSSKKHSPVTEGVTEGSVDYVTFLGYKMEYYLLKEALESYKKRADLFEGQVLSSQLQNDKLMSENTHLKEENERLMMNLSSPKVSESNEDKPMSIMVHSQAVEKSKSRKRKLSDSSSEVALPRGYPMNTQVKVVPPQAAQAVEKSKSQKRKSGPVLEMPSRVSCVICLKADHIQSLCPYLKYCPPGAVIDKAAAKKVCFCCQKRNCLNGIVVDDDAGFCVIKHCPLCTTFDDHWVEECPKLTEDERVWLRESDEPIAQSGRLEE